MTALDDGWTAVVGNLQKSRKSWVQLSRILGREGSYPSVSGVFFKEVVQLVLLFRSETCIMTPCMGQSLGGVQHRVATWITSRNPQMMLDRS